MGETPPLRVFVVTSTQYAWAIKPFCYLFNLYWSELQPVVVMGFQPPDFPLPPNFSFYKVNTPDLGLRSWSTALIEFLQAQPDSHFCLLLEDYFPIRTVDHNGIRTLHEYCSDHPDVLRMDLTCDVLYVNGDAREAPELESYGHYDVIYKPDDAAYRLSLQAAIWNKALFLSLLKPGKSSWETEMHLSVPPEMKVLGVRQWPLRYANAVYQGKIKQSEIERIPEPHRSVVKPMLPNNWVGPIKTAKD